MREAVTVASLAVVVLLSYALAGMGAGLNLFLPDEDASSVTRWLERMQVPLYAFGTVAFVLIYVVLR